MKIFALKKHEITWGIISTHVSPPEAKNFESFAHFRVLRSNLAKSLTTGRPFWGGGGGSGQNFGGAKTYLGPPTQIFGGGGGPWPPWPPPSSATPGGNAHYLIIASRDGRILVRNKQ